MNARDSAVATVSYDSENISVDCTCCKSYLEWKDKHRTLATSLQRAADNILTYTINRDEVVTVTMDGEEHQFKGTIRASVAAPNGPCLGLAMSGGQHPYVCVACDALTRGQTSPLNRRVLRASKLKHPRSDELRATRSGVAHKYVSVANLESAIFHRKKISKTNQQKVDRLLEANKKLLSQSWNNSPSIRPFVETLISLLRENKLSAFDLSFLQNWICKKQNGRFARADEQARKLTILYSNRLGEKLYTTTAPILGLPTARQARKIRAMDIGDQHYLPGINNWALDLAAQGERRPLQNGMDGTRVIRVVELYLDQYLVGKAFPPDIRSFPSKDNLDQAISWQQIQDYVLDVREQCAYAAEAYSFNLSDTTGKNADILTGSFPESKSGVTGDHIFALMLEFEKRAQERNLPLVGHCTDSASNSLNALLFLASPSTYNQLDGVSLVFLGLERSDYSFFAPFLRQSFPSIAYPCWDHSGRTVLRNLLNARLTLVSGILANTADGFQKYKKADAQDLRKLKFANPSCSIKFADITPKVKQNCDATSRVLTHRVIDDLKKFVPESEGTQLYLVAATATHEPFRNTQFGPPPVVARSLWKGLMIWRRWRRYIELTDCLTLTDNFMSRSHYLTEELLVHAGINHQLALFFSFPNLPVKEYSMRNTGNRGLEAIHGMFRGGTTSLPITSPNLSFAEFLTRMNKATQIHRAEHQLSQIEGHTIVASKKKRKTYARQSSHNPREDTSVLYQKPATFDEFVKQINKACDDGDKDAKDIIEELAPEMADTLINYKEWDKPRICTSMLPSELKVLSKSAQIPSTDTSNVVDQLIKARLGPTPDPDTHGENNSEQYQQAIANLITDINITDQNATVAHGCVEQNGRKTKVASILRDLQPHRERPSKDRATRFAAGDMLRDMAIPEIHNIIEFQYWAILPLQKNLKAAKVFVLGQIVFVSDGENSCRSISIENPNACVVFVAHTYDPVTRKFRAAGRSGICKAAKVLLNDVTPLVQQDEDGDITLTEYEFEYEPFHEDLDISQRLETLTNNDVTGVDEVEDSDEECETFLVEKIVKKRFRLNQYEYLVKWQGYSDADNTWELPSNIPDHILTGFEKALSQPSGSLPRREGLRQSRKLVNREDFILNL